jgi:arylsulfatase A-like enzyme
MPSSPTASFFAGFARPFLSLCIVAASTVLAGLPGHSQPAKQPNFLILLTDDQRWDTIGVNNPDLPIRTPHIDRLANEGILFTRGFVTTPICAVSRASILSGQYARNHRIHYFVIPFSDEVFVRTYPAILQSGGYFTGQIGKYGVGATEEQQASFDFFDGDLAQGPAFHQYEGERVHDSEWLTRRTRDFLDRVPASRPFVLQVNYKAPHPSSAVAPEDEGKLAGVRIPAVATDTPEDGATLPAYVRRGLGGVAYKGEFGSDARRSRHVTRYLEKILSVDRSIGSILAELEARGLDENTVILFLSDHGTHFGEKQLTGKWTPYEPSLRIPFILYDPREAKAGGFQCEEMVLNIDIAPTLIDLAGLSIPEAMDGRSLRPLMRRDAGVAWRKHFFFEHFTAPATVPRPVPRNAGVRTENAKFFRWLDPSPPVQEYYDLADDPIERFNRVHDKSEDADRLRRLFDGWDAKHPENYEYLSYTHRPQVGNPDIDFEKLKAAHPNFFKRIDAARKRFGATWKEAVDNPELRWQIGKAAGFFY